MITGSSSVFCQLITWISTFVVARILNPDDYGLAAMAGVYIGVTEYINELGVGTAIVQRQDLNEEDIRGIYSVAIIFGAFITVVSFLIAPLVSSFFKESKLINILQIMSLTFVISSVKSVQRNLMIREMAFLSIAKVDILCGILTSVFALICALNGFGVWTLVIQYLSMNLLGCIGSFWYERRLPGRITNWPKLKEMLAFGLGIMLSRFFMYINRNIDSLIIGKFLGKSLLGNYSLALSLANKPFEKILPILNQVFVPHFSNIQVDKLLVKKHLLRIISIELFIFSPIFVLISLTAGDIIVTLLGAKWIGAVLPMQVFSMLGFCKYIENRISLVLTSQGHAKSQVHYATSLSLVMTISFGVLAYLYGMTGVLLAWSICYPSVLIVYFAYFIKLLDIKVSQLITVFTMPIFSTFIMSISVYLIVLIDIDQSLIRLFCKLIIAVLAYVGSNYLLNKRFIYEIIDLIKNRNVLPQLH